MGSAIRTIGPELGETEEPIGDLTAEALLRRHARQRPEALALEDPPNRDALGLGPPRSLRYAEADAAADVLAQIFIDLGLEPGDLIGLQLPNVIEQPLTILAAWRAGLTVAVLPMLWRRTELEAVCALLHPKALVGVGRFAAEGGTQTLCEIAAGEMSVRFVLGFGPELADGVTGLDEAFLSKRRGGAPEVAARANTGPAMINFTARPGSPLVPVLRGEEELLAQGAMTVLALSLTAADAILNPYPLTGPQGLSLALMPWLISGAALIQHQPFDYAAFVRQILDNGATVTALPPPLVAALQNDDVLAMPACKLTRLGCVWSPPLLAGSDGKPPEARFDLYPIGDLAGIVRTRDGIADPRLLPLGEIKLGERGGTLLAETALGPLDADGIGALLLRGPIVPRGDAEGPLAPDARGYVDTGHRAKPEAASALRLVPDSELLYHGGCAIDATELDAVYQAFPAFLDAACFTLPDAVMGDRIFAAVVPAPGEPVSLDALHAFLRVREVAPFKYPDKFVVVREIPRDASGRVLRDEILRQV